MKRRGFTLIEVLLSLVVAAMTLVIISRGMATAARATTTAERRARAAMLASQKMAEVEAGEVSLVHSLPGDFSPEEPDFAFELTSNLKTSPDLYEVVVRVTWTDGSTQNSFQMTRLLRQKS